MGVAVKQKITHGQVTRRDMDQAKSFAVLLQSQTHREIKPVVVIALHGVKRPPDCEAVVQGFQIAKIPEMPDFIGLREFRQDFFRKSAVGIGDDCDA